MFVQVASCSLAAPCAGPARVFPVSPAQGAGRDGRLLGLGRHLQAHREAPAGLGLQPGEAVVAVYVRDEGLQPRKRAKEHAQLSVLDAPLGDLDDVRAPAEAAHERGLEATERAHGAQLFQVRPLRGLSEHVAGPDGLGGGDPRPPDAPERHARELEGVGDKARAQGPGARDARPSGSPQDHVGWFVIFC